MLAYDLGNVVFVGVSRVGIQRSVGYVSRVLVNAVVYAAVQANPGHFASETVFEHPNRDPLRTLPVWTHKIEFDMVGGVASHEFIQQGWRSRGCQAGDHADTRSDKVRLHGRKACAAGPQRSGINLRPGIVDVAG